MEIASKQYVQNCRLIIDKIFSTKNSPPNIGSFGCQSYASFLSITAGYAWRQIFDPFRFFNKLPAEGDRFFASARYRVKRWEIEALKAGNHYSLADQRSRRSNSDQNQFSKCLFVWKKDNAVVGRFIDKKSRFNSFYVFNSIKEGLL